MSGAGRAYGGSRGGYGAGGSNEPVLQQGEPQGLLRAGDVAVRIEGELVPVVNVELGGRENVYFEHHVLLWKDPQVSIGLKPLKGAVKRVFAGLQIFVTQAAGPGNISFSRDAPGQIAPRACGRGLSSSCRGAPWNWPTKGFRFRILARSGISYGDTHMFGLFSMTLESGKVTGR
jgi:hypothetical protein